MQKRLKNRTIFVTKICMSENQDELKVQIKAWLKQQNISRNDFAEECFVSPNTVRNWLGQGSHSQRQGSSHPAHDGKDGKGEKTEGGGNEPIGNPSPSG